MATFHVDGKPKLTILANALTFVKITKHYEKKGCFAIGLAIQFLNCKEHLQLLVFIRHEC